MILEILRSGYRLPFVSTLEAKHFQNNSSATGHGEFLDSEIAALLESGRIRAVTSKPFVVNPLTVSVQASGKKRMILDLRHVNTCLAKYKFTLEDSGEFAEMLEKDGWMFKFDISSAYHHVEIFQEHQQFLGFQWRGQHYVFTVLPFGLSTAPYIFTKILRVLVRYWRSRGIRCLLFYDDGAGTHTSDEICRQQAQLVKSSLCQAGFAVSEQKSVWQPTQFLTFLGLESNLQEFTVAVPAERVARTEAQIAECLQNLHRLTARAISRVAGLITSCRPALGDVTLMMTRAMHCAIDSSPSWDARVNREGDSLLTSQLLFWQTFLRRFNGTKGVRVAAVVPEKILFSDASAVGGAAHLADQTKVFSYSAWTAEEAARSSTWRELQTVYVALSSMIPLLKQKAVLFYTDNQNVVRILQKGSSKADLQAIVMKLFLTAMQHGISVSADWIPREQNQLADFYSKHTVDRDDWAVSALFFAQINRLFGPFTVDRFANEKNAKCSCFNSRFYCPGTSGVDAFAQDWSGHKNYLVPPLRFVPKCLQHLQTCGAVGTFVLPLWRSALFYPLFFDGAVPRKEVTQFQVFSKASSDVFVRGSNTSDMFSADNKHPFDVLVAKIDMSSAA